MDNKMIEDALLSEEELTHHHELLEGLIETVEAIYTGECGAEFDKYLRLIKREAAILRTQYKFRRIMSNK